MIKYKTDEECIGCLSLTKVLFPHTGECKFTNDGITTIPYCECKICLLKVICKTACEKFLNTAKNYSLTNKLTLSDFPNKKAVD